MKIPSNKIIYFPSFNLFLITINYLMSYQKILITFWCFVSVGEKQDLYFQISFIV